MSNIYYGFNTDLQGAFNAFFEKEVGFKICRSNDTQAAQLAKILFNALYFPQNYAVCLNANNSSSTRDKGQRKISMPMEELAKRIVLQEAR